MTLVRWEPVREFGTLQHEINRRFGGFFEQLPAQPASGETRRQWIPAVDLLKTDGAYVLRADLPGLASDDVKIEVEQNVLTISGERRTRQEQRAAGYYRFERASGTFARSLTLPQGVDTDGIEANFADGVLEVRIPAPERPRARRVQITTTAQATAVDGSDAAEEATLAEPALETLAAAA
jgi:HSP20 family protein